MILILCSMAAASALYCTNYGAPMRVVVDPDLIIEALLNEQLTKDTEKLFELIESSLIQFYLTESGLDKIYWSIEKNNSPIIARQIINELLEIIQISPSSMHGDILVTNRSQKCLDNFLLVLSVNDLYQRHLWEQKLL